MQPEGKEKSTSSGTVFFFKKNTAATSETSFQVMLKKKNQWSSE